MSESNLARFKTVAARIVGQWHYHNKVGSYTFSLISSFGETGDVFIAKGSRHRTATYRIEFDEKRNVILSIQGTKEPYEAIIKVLTDDSLVLFYDKGLEILQRMPDIGFADELINRL